LTGQLIAQSGRDDQAALLLCRNSFATQTQYSTPSTAWRPDGSGLWVNNDDGKNGCKDWSYRHEARRPRRYGACGQARSTFVSTQIHNRNGSSVEDLASGRQSQLQQSVPRRFTTCGFSSFRNFVRGTIRMALRHPIASRFRSSSRPASNWNQKHLQGCCSYCMSSAIGIGHHPFHVTILLETERNPRPYHLRIFSSAAILDSRPPVQHLRGSSEQNRRLYLPWGKSSRR